MLPSIERLLSLIRSGAVLSGDAVAAINHDAILDARDFDEEFESEWLRVSDEIDRRWNESNIDPATKQQLDEIRRESFLRVSNATSQHEIASYVSDDFDLIARSVVLGIEDPFVDWMWQTYLDQSVPYTTK